MAQWLKQSTQVVIQFGPFVSPTDGVTPQTGLITTIDHATTGIKVSKNGGALAVRAATVTASAYDDYGNYRVTLKDTDTNTLGTLRVQFAAAASCLPVWRDFIVIPATIYDGLITGSGGAFPNAVAGAAGGLFIAGTNAPVTITGSGNALTLLSTGANGHGLSATANGTGKDLNASSTTLSLAKSTNITGLNDIAAGAQMDLVNAPNGTAITAIQTGVSLSATGLDAVTQSATGMVEIAKAVWDRALTGVTHNIATSAGRRLRQLQGAAIAFSGTVTGTPTTTVIPLDAAASTTNDFYVPGMLILESAGGAIQFRRIASYVGGATKEVTVATAFPTPPVAGDIVTIAPLATIRVSAMDDGVITPAVAPDLNSSVSSVQAVVTSLYARVGITCSRCEFGTDRC
jgi:hypothetical protein